LPRKKRVYTVLVDLDKRVAELKLGFCPVISTQTMPRPGILGRYFF
jgi:hypothetical protein